MQTILLLDLENTLIWDWNDDPRLMCSLFPELKEWLIFHACGINTRIGLLSWAVWDEKDLDIFNNNGIRQNIELTHGFTFDDELIFTRNTILDKFRIWKRMPFLDDIDFMSFFNKRHIIEEIWLNEFFISDTKVILFDDTVPDITLINNTIPNNCLQLINPWTIIKK